MGAAVHDLQLTLILLAACQGMVLAVALWRRPVDILANRLLGCLVFSVGLMLLFGFADARFGLRGHPQWLGLGVPLPFLFSPLLYLYILALTRPLPGLSLRHWVHFTPFVADVIYMANAFYFITPSARLALIEAYLQGQEPLSLAVMEWFQVLAGLGYLFAGLRELGRYRRRIADYYSDLTALRLRWLGRLIQGHVLVWTLVLLARCGRELGWGGQALAGVSSAVQVGSALVIFLTGYVSLWQPGVSEKAGAAAQIDREDPAPLREDRVVSKTPLLAAPAEVSSPPPPPTAAAASATVGSADSQRYQRNRLSETEAEELAEAIRKLMDHQQLFRDANLTLPQLAEAAGTPPHTLSQVLNVHLGENFYQLVNRHRAEALKAQLSAPDQRQRPVLELALEVGFNSKSTLNSFFKKYTGLTPTQFRKSALE